MKRYLLLVGSLVMLWGTEARATPADITEPPSSPPFGLFYYSSGHEDKLLLKVGSEKSTFQGEDYEEGQKVGDGQRDGQKQEYVHVDEHEYGDGYRDGRRDEYEGGKKDGDGDGKGDGYGGGKGDGDGQGGGHGCKKHECTPVPEPASLLLLGAGLAGIGIWRRKAAR